MNISIIQSIGVWKNDFIPIWTGFSANPTTIMHYSLNGKMCSIILVTSSGTSNATTTTVTLPYNAKTGMLSRPTAITIDNGINASGWASTRSGSNIMDLYRTPATLTWTASGTKGIVLVFTYEVE